MSLMMNDNTTAATPLPRGSSPKEEGEVSSGDEASASSAPAAAPAADPEYYTPNAANLMLLTPQQQAPAALDYDSSAQKRLFGDMEAEAYERRQRRVDGVVCATHVTAVTGSAAAYARDSEAEDAAEEDAADSEEDEEEEEDTEEDEAEEVQQQQQLTGTALLSSLHEEALRCAAERRAEDGEVSGPALLAFLHKEAVRRAKAREQQEKEQQQEQSRTIARLESELASAHQMVNQLQNQHEDLFTRYASLLDTICDAVNAARARLQQSVQNEFA